MKGLLLKDWYMIKTYCKLYLVMAVLFLAASFVSSDNLFFVFYPCLLCGMIPVNLLAYDERSHWTQYSCTLPYTRAQLVCAKYLVGLFCQLAVLLGAGIVQSLKMGFTPDLGVLMLSMEDLGALAEALRRLEAAMQADGGRMTLLRLCGIAIVAEFASDICRDAGEAALAKRIDVGVRLGITAAALPAAGEIMERIAGLLA